MNSEYLEAVTLRRRAIEGAPHTYYITGRSANDRPVLGPLRDLRAFTDLLERVRQVFDLRLYAFAVEPSAYHLVLRHADEAVEGDERLRERWALLGGRQPPDAARLRRRLTSLGGVMQTFTQRYSHEYHRRHGGRGHLWAGRYRACLLADDAALLAAVAWVEEETGARLPATATSRHRLRGGRGAPQLAPLPVRATPDGSAVPADDALLALPPPTPEDEQDLFLRFAAALDAPARAAYGAALRRAWTIGRPESLTEAVARLGRARGRGRSRRQRELDDDLGLCGVWG